MPMATSGCPRRRRSIPSYLAAAAAAVPQTLLAQLAPGGRLAMPLGGAEQVISLVERGERDLSKRDSMRYASCRCCREWNEYCEQDRAAGAVPILGGCASTVPAPVEDRAAAQASPMPRTPAATGRQPKGGACTR
jgi:hypothetical protein